MSLRTMSLAWILILGSPIAARSAGNIVLSGYVKNFALFFRNAPVHGGNGSGLEPQWLGSDTNRLRIRFSYRPHHRVDFDAAYDITPAVQSPALFTSAFPFARINPYSYRVWDLDARLYPDGTETANRFAIYQNLDRASISFHTPATDVVIGRQAIAWGAARVVNPTDVLAPFTFETLDTEDRVGVDAVRVRIPIGALSEIDAGYVFGENFEFRNSAVYGRTKFNVHQTDISLLALHFRENLLTGFDVARSIGGAGGWLEAAYVFAKSASDDSSGFDSNYFRVSAGLDYSLTANVYGFAEYHFNGAGVSSPAEYLGNLSSPAYTEGSVYLMGRHYLIPGVTWQVTPLLSFTGEFLINLTDPSGYLTPQLEYSIAQDIYLGAGAFFGLGRRPASSSVEGAFPVPASEFGAYPNVFFGSFRYYF